MNASSRLAASLESIAVSLDRIAGPHLLPEDRTGKRFNCSFCGKREDVVAKLIAGPGAHIMICDECVDLCRDILAQNGIAQPALTERQKDEVRDLIATAVLVERERAK